MYYFNPFIIVVLVFVVTAGEEPLAHDFSEPQNTTDQAWPIPYRSGTLFTVWGKSYCPNTLGTWRVYNGIAAKSEWNKRGGGIDYQCLTNRPQYLVVKPGVQEARSFIAATEYEDWAGTYSSQSFRGQTVRCAVCLATVRSVTLMIPGRIGCPYGWTREYFGYLTAERTGHPSQSTYVCLHKDLKVIPKVNAFGSTMMHVEAKCNGAKHCPPYKPGLELTCVVCTK